MKTSPLALLVLALARCAPVDVVNAITPKGGVSITRDVAYAAGDRRVLDVYRQTGATGRPVIVFFYGGSWREGSKAIYPFLAATLARRGNVVVVPDYRLYPEVRFPAFLADCAQAVAWTMRHAAEFGGDPDRVFLMGHSAGAYNAAMLGLDPAYLAAAGADRARLAGIIGLAGPYDFLPITGEDIKPVFATAEDPQLTQPITYVDGHAPPMLLLTGEADTEVLPKNTRALAARIRAAGGQAETRFYPGLGHIGLVAAIAPVFQWRAPVLAAVQGFIDSHAAPPSGRISPGASGQAPPPVPHADPTPVVGQPAG
jgi:acetyl esterase/lipase